MLPHWAFYVGAENLNSDPVFARQTHCRPGLFPAPFLVFRGIFSYTHAGQNKDLISQLWLMEGSSLWNHLRVSVHFPHTFSIPFATWSSDTVSPPHWTSKAKPWIPTTVWKSQLSQHEAILDNVGKKGGGREKLSCRRSD